MNLLDLLHNSFRPTKNQALQMLIEDSNLDILTDARRNCYRATTDPLFQKYFTAIAFGENVSGSSEWRQVEDHFATCKWCEAERRASLQIMQTHTNPAASRTDRRTARARGPVQELGFLSKVLPIVRKINLKFASGLLFAAAALLIIAIAFNPWAKPLITQATIHELALDRSDQAVLASAMVDLHDIEATPVAKGEDTSALVQLTSPSQAYVLDQSPVFRWRVLIPGGRVESIEISDNAKTLASSLISPANESWQSPVRLSDNHLYIWRLTAVKGSYHDTASGIFYVPSTPVLRAMDADFSHLDPVRQAAIYIKADRLEQAAEELRLASSRTHSSSERSQINELVDKLSEMRKAH